MANEQKKQKPKSGNPTELKPTELEMEPIINNGEPKWLCIKKEKTLPDIPARSVEEILEKPAEPEIKITFSTKEAGLWQCKKCEATIQSDKQPDHCSACDRASNFTRLTREIDPDVWLLPKWEDIPVEDLDMLGVYDDMTSLWKKAVVFPEEIYRKIIILWIISTYKRERWYTIGFPLFLGLPSSGKSWCLDLISALGYRMIAAASATFPGLVRQSHVNQAGFCIDEIQTRFDSRSEEGKKWLQYIKPSYRRGNIYLAADNQDQMKTVSYRNFSFKAFGGEYMSDYALSTRCIPFEMQKDYPQIDEIKFLMDDIHKIKTKLLNYKYKTNPPPDFPDDYGIRGRLKEIYGNIICTGLHIGIDVTDIKEFVKNIEIEQQEELKNTTEYEILTGIRKLSCNETLDDAPKEVSYNDIREAMSWEPTEKYTKGQMHKTIGFSLREKLKLKTTRRKTGWVVVLTDPKSERKINYYYKRYGIISNDGERGVNVG